METNTPTVTRVSIAGRAGTRVTFANGETVTFPRAMSAGEAIHAAVAAMRDGRVLS